MEFWQVSPAFHSIFRHEKKVLALVLAFACAFTMFAGAASFTDEADISENNRDAVELLTTLKIIKGYEDGSFDPEGTVDRAEMAKMIYTIRNGGNDDASAHVGNTTSFTDISGHWAEGYIKYLQNTGIVAGKSATKFDPDAQVTTAEAMKMALALAGYDEVNAGLTGIDWQKNTLTYATTIGLTDNVNSAMSAGCSRQDAAQILANCLEANAVRWSSVVSNFVNDSKTGLSSGGDPITVGYKWMDLTIYVGRMVSSGKLNLEGVSDAGVDRFSVDVDTVNGIEVDRWTWDNDSRNYYNSGVLTVKDGQDHTDLVGLEVKVLTGEKIDDVYGVYATGTSNVVETTMDQIDVQSNDDMKIDGTTYDTKGAAVYQDLEMNSTRGWWGNTTETAKTIDDVFTSDGEKVADDVKLIDWDNNGDYETIITNTVAMAQVTYVGSSSISVGNIGAREYYKTDERPNGHPIGTTRSLDRDDNTIYEDVAKDDYAVIRQDLYTGDYIVEEATEVTGTINGLVENERRVRIDGNWYTLANDNSGDHNVYTIPESRTVFTNGDQVALYVVGDIAYMAKSTVGNDANRAVLMVYDMYGQGGSWNNEHQAKVILANGDKLKVTISDGDRSNVDFDDLTIGQMYRYSINNDDEYELTVLANDGELAGYDKIIDTDGLVATNHNKVEAESDTDYTIADDAVVFAMIGDDDADVYTGQQVKDATSITNHGNYASYAYLTEDAQQALIQKEAGFTYARMLNIALEGNLSSITNYGWVLSSSVKSNSDDGRVMEYTFFDGVQLRTALERTNSDKRYLTDGALISFQEDGEGYIKDVEEIERGNGDLDTWRPAAITAADDNGNIAIVRWDDNELNPVNDVLETNEDTKLILVNSRASSDEDKCVTDDTSYNHTAEPVGDGSNKYYINAKYILGDDGEVDFILIDVDGRLNGEGTIEITRGMTVTVTADNAEYDSSDTIGFTVTPSNFLTNTHDNILSTGNYSGYDKVDLKKVVDEDGDDVTASFDIATPIDLSQNGTAVAGTISMVGTPAAGDYTATIATQDTTTDPVYATVEFTITRGTHDRANGFTVEGELTASAAPTKDKKVADLVKAVTANNTDNWNVTGYSLKVNDKDASTLAAGTTFASGQVVTLEIAIECADNYVFADGLSVTTQLGSVSPIVSVAEDNLTATITYTWTVA